MSILYFLKGYDEYVKVQNNDIADDTKKDDVKKDAKKSKKLIRNYAI